MTSSSLLGQISIETFLANYWQKKPILIRSALPHFSNLISPDDLAALSMRTDLISRLILEGETWEVKSGPFSEDVLTGLGTSRWSLLVHDINFAVKQADTLLHSFDFIPKARLDDLMISLSPQGGNVGPHYDSFDVFLLQGLGKKRWQISQQKDLGLIPDAPLKLLSKFEPQEEWILEPGDMLYLPPHTAHYGVALDLCMTYSIGFRAPAYQELFHGFMDYLGESQHLYGRFTDPDLTYNQNSAILPEELIESTCHQFQKIKWDRHDVIRFLGSYLTEPKNHVTFQRPKKALNFSAFQQRILKQGIRLHPGVKLLFHSNQFWMNGEELSVIPIEYKVLRHLANQRMLLDPELLHNLILQQKLYSWYLLGNIQIGI
ncbi:MAG: cupin domain-containing protein [Proteobacteria bacterium]|nr:cupin domain-containing protein [Pseudomonadota bacterium]